MIAALGDDSIRVRGEAFCTLLLYDTDVSARLIMSLGSADRHIRGYSALALANRGCRSAASGISALLRDDSAMVRECAAGALGYIGARSEAAALHGLLSDPEIAVRKSALAALVSIGSPPDASELEALRQGADAELASMCRFS